MQVRGTVSSRSEADKSSVIELGWQVDADRKDVKSSATRYRLHANMTSLSANATKS